MFAHWPFKTNHISIYQISKYQATKKPMIVHQSIFVGMRSIRISYLIREVVKKVDSLTCGCTSWGRYPVLHGSPPPGELGWNNFPAVIKDSLVMQCIAVVPIIAKSCKLRIFHPNKPKGNRWTIQVRATFSFCDSAQWQSVISVTLDYYYMIFNRKCLYWSVLKRNKNWEQCLTTKKMLSS